MTLSNSSEFKLGLLLLDGFNAMAVNAFIDPFRSANYLRGHALYHWQFISASGGAVEASNGMSLTGLTQIEAIQTQFDLVVVNASWNVERFKHPKILNWLRILASKGTLLCGIDTGAFILAFAGLLNDRRASVHYEHIAAFRELFPHIEMGEDLYVIDGDRLSCSGGMAAADLSLEIIKMQHGLELANASARYIFHERLRSGFEGQMPDQTEPTGYAAPKVLRDAIIVMEKNLIQPLNIGEVAEEIGISQRQLDRLFKRHTGVAPVRYYLDTRLDRARGLITQTTLPILDIAIACGFTSHAHFSRMYRKRFSTSPQTDRTEGRVPFQFRSFPSHSGI